jgi:hypothetical protein
VKSLRRISFKVILIHKMIYRYFIKRLFTLDLPNLIRNAVRDALNKDFLVSALKEAFPEGLAVENPRNPVNRPLPQNNAIENAKVI